MKSVVTIILLFISTQTFCFNEADSLLLENLKSEITSLHNSVDSLSNVTVGILADLPTEKGKYSRETLISIISIFLSIISAAAAIYLIIKTIRHNKDNLNLMSVQTEEQRKLARAQMTPLINGYRNGFDKTEFIICNYGGGTAIITEFLFEKDGKKENSISGFIDIKNIDKEVDWDDKWTFRQRYYFLYPHESLKVYTITLENLKNRFKIPENRAKKIIDEVNMQRKGIKVKIKYIDTFEYNSENEGNIYEYEYVL